MNDPSVDSDIETHLKMLESDESVEILYATESGSRAWGFESPDSDFDIRFLYRHNRDWYLSVQKRRDVIEAMVEPDLDFAGWDLQKALRLLYKSNPSLLEWLSSPIVYAENAAFMAEFRELGARCTSLHCEPGAVAEELSELLIAKSMASELGFGPRRPVLDSFIESEMARIGDIKFDAHPAVDLYELDDFFRRHIV